MPTDVLVDLLAGLLGLLVGSFLNVVIARVPDGESVVRPGSRCPSCGVPIGPRDNVPVLSWLLLRGRARCCGVPISRRYPLVEAGTAIAFAAVTAWTGSVGSLWALPAFLYLAAVSIALAVIDVDTLRLPIMIVGPSYLVGGLLLGMASLAQRDGAAMVRALIGAAALWLMYRGMHLAYPAGMGYGDVRLAGVLGLYLGWLGWEQLVTGGFFGFLCGGLGGVALIAVRRAGLKSHIPYGPYMLAGAWLGAVAGHPIASWYLNTAGL